MNDRIKELMLEADYAAPELACRANKLVELVVDEVLEILADTKNYNKHIYTTWDHGQAITVAEELATAVQTRFGTNKQFKVNEHGTMGRKVEA